VNCTPASIGTGSSSNCSAVVNDPSGNPYSPQPSVNWSIQAPAGSNTIVPTSPGATTATFNAVTPSATPFTVQVDVPSTGDSGTFAITVSPTAPQITSVTPTVFVTSVSISISATAFGGHPLTYLCAVDPTSPSSTLTFPSSESNSSTVVGIFSAAGNYVARCTVKDTSTNISSSQALAFGVSQFLTGIKVSPNNITLKTLANQVFTAVGTDQFNHTMNNIGTVVWNDGSANFGGTSQSTSFTAPSQLGRTITITATATGANGAVSGRATVNVINYDVSGAFAFPVPYKSTMPNHFITFRGLQSSAKIRIYTVTGQKVFSVDLPTQNNVDYRWDIRNSGGESLASGVYLYVIESPETKKDGKLIIIQ
jgi:hypothetical protein